MPVGAHVLLGHLAEPLNQPTDALLSLDQLRVQENLQEFEEWVSIHTSHYEMSTYSRHVIICRKPFVSLLLTQRSSENLTSNLCLYPICRGNTMPVMLSTETG